MLEEQQFELGTKSSWISNWFLIKIARGTQHGEGAVGSVSAVLSSQSRRLATLTLADTLSNCPTKMDPQVLSSLLKEGFDKSTGMSQRQNEPPSLAAA